jgi:hypothetical protein
VQITGILEGKEEKRHPILAELGRRFKSQRIESQRGEGKQGHSFDWNGVGKTIANEYFFSGRRVKRLSIRLDYENGRSDPSLRSGFATGRREAILHYVQD